MIGIYSFSRISANRQTSQLIFNIFHKIFISDGDAFCPFGVSLVA